MNPYLPLLIIGAIIGTFATVFLLVFLLEKNKKETMGFERHMEDKVIVKRLLRYARPYWKNFALCLLIMLVSVVYDIVSPLLIGQITGMFAQDFALSDLYIRVAIYAGILVVSMICTYLQAMILQKTGQKILSSMRLDVFTHIEKLSHNQVGGQAVLGRQLNSPTPWLTERHGYDPTLPAGHDPAEDRSENPVLHAAGCIHPH